jgi:hypothetical protein
MKSYDARPQLVAAAKQVLSDEAQSEIAKQECCDAGTTGRNQFKLLRISLSF